MNPYLEFLDIKQCVEIGTDHNAGHLSEIVDNCPDLRTISG